jgi:hypothetical protein
MINVFNLLFIILIMSSVKFIDKNKNSILIKYDFRSGNNWFANHYFDIYGDICHNTNFDKIIPVNQEQAALINFIIENHNTKGSEYLSDFEALALDVSKAEQTRQDVTLLNNKTDKQLCEMIYNFRECNNVDFSIDNIKRVIALLQHLQNDFELPLECLSKIKEDCDELTLYNRTYLILTNDEADDRVDSYYRDNIQNFLGIDNGTWNTISPYFDEDSFVDECLQDGRGRALARYGSEEIEVCVELDGEYQSYYLYRQN